MTKKSRGNKHLKKEAAKKGNGSFRTRTLERKKRDGSTVRRNGEERNLEQGGEECYKGGGKSRKRKRGVMGQKQKRQKGWEGSLISRHHSRINTNGESAESL